MIRNILLIAALFGSYGCSHLPFVNTAMYPSHPLAGPATERLLSADLTLSKEAIVELKSVGAGAMPELSRRFTESPPEIRETILTLATEIGTPEPLVVDIFQQASEDPVAAVRLLCATKASTLPEYSAALAPIMFTLLASDATAEVRSAALTTLGKFPSATQPDSSLIFELLNDRHSMVAAAASTIAVKRNEPYLQAAARAALPRLIGSLTDPQPATRAAILFAIGQFRRTAAPAISPVKGVASSDPVPEVRLQAALTLLRIDTPEARRAALDTLKMLASSADSGPLVRKAARSTLAGHQGKSAKQHPENRQ